MVFGFEGVVDTIVEYELICSQHQDLSCNGLDRLFVGLCAWLPLEADMSHHVDYHLWTLQD